MVSFSCEGCNETMLKKKVAGHLGRCGAPVTCIDCSKTFPGQTFKSHNQCITEDQKYQGKMYKPKANPTAPVKTEEKKPAAEQSKPSKAESNRKAASTVKVSKQTSLKKLLKQLRKEHKLDKKQILEKISVDTSGKLILIP